MINIFTIYTDGSCVGPPLKRSAGYGVIILNSQRQIYRQIYGKINLDKATNQVAQLCAAIYGIGVVMNNFPSSLYPEESITVYTDSAYIVNCFYQKWYEKWEQNGWLNSKNQPVQNAELWKKLIESTKYYPINFIKVKGHGNNQLNNRCDQLAKLGASLGE